MNIIKLSIIFFVFIAFISCNGKSNGSSNTAKNFTLVNMSGGDPISLESFSGKPVILNFWASWCAPCRKEMPFLENIWNKYKNDGLVLIGINVMDDMHEAEKTLKEFNISYLNLKDEEGNVTTKYGIHALPVTYFIDRSGVISKINYGPFLGESGEKLFNDNLAKILQ